MLAWLQLGQWTLRLHFPSTPGLPANVSKYPAVLGWEFTPPCMSLAFRLGHLSESRGSRAPALHARIMVRHSSYLLGIRLSLVLFLHKSHSLICL